MRDIPGFTAEQNESLRQEFRQENPHGFLICEFVETTNYHPLNNSTVDTTDLLRKLSIITGIIHTQEILDFYYYFYELGGPSKEFVNEVDIALSNRKTQLFDMLTGTLLDQFDPFIFEDLMSELSSLMDIDFTFTDESSFRAVCAIYRWINQRGKVASQIRNEEFAVRMQIYNDILLKIIESPNYPTEIPTELLTQLSDHIGMEVTRENAVIRAEYMELTESDSTLVQSYLMPLRFGGYYESILLLPKEQRDQVWEIFSAQVKKVIDQRKDGENFAWNDTDQDICLEQVKALGISIEKSSWHGDHISAVERTTRMQQCRELYENTTHMHQLPLEQKLALVEELFTLRGVKWEYRSDISEKDINDYIHAYFYVFIMGPGPLLGEEDKRALVGHIKAERFLAQKALGINERLDVSKLANTNRLFAFNLPVGRIPKLKIEFVGPPGLGKSTMINYFSRRTTAFCSDEKVPDIKRIVSAGITSEVDLLGSIPESQFTIDEMSKIASQILTERGDPSDTEVDLESIVYFSQMGANNTPQFREYDSDNPLVILSQDFFNQNAFFHGLIAADRVKNLRTRAMGVISLRDQYLEQLTKSSYADLDRPTLVVIFLGEISDILKRRDPSENINPEFLDILLREYVELFYALTRPEKKHPPIAVLALNTSKMNPDETFRSILRSIQTLQGPYASTLLRPFQREA